MSYQIVIINGKGATLRTAPSTSGGEIAKAAQGEVFDIDRLVYEHPQPFNTTYIPEYWRALQAKVLRGDVWAQLKGLRTYQNNLVTPYVAVYVDLNIYSVVVGAEDIVSGGVSKIKEHQIRQDEIDRIFLYLSTRRADLERE